MDAETKIPTKTKRSDAPSIPVDGDLRREKLVNKDRDREYIYVDPRVEQFGVGDYHAKGYTIERRREGGVRPLIEPPDVADGTEIKQLGCVLMSRPRALRDAEFASQQATADGFDKRILKPGGIDGLRGVAGYTGIKNASTGLYRDED